MLGTGGAVVNKKTWLNSRDPLRLIDYHAHKGCRRKLRLLAIAFARSVAGLVQPMHPRADLTGLLAAAERFADEEIDRGAYRRAAAPIRSQLPPLNPHCRRWVMPRSIYAQYPWGAADVFVVLSYEAIELRWNGVAGTLVAIERDAIMSAEDVTRLSAYLCDLPRDIFGNPFRPVTFSPEWRSDTAVSLVRQMYDAREFSAMPILADALQDAGCDRDDILDHCRGPGPHVRGCWVCDLVMGKE